MEEARTAVVDQLAASQARLLELVDGLTAEQWASVPPRAAGLRPSVWSTSSASRTAYSGLIAIRN